MHACFDSVPRNLLNNPVQGICLAFVDIWWGNIKIKGRGAKKMTFLQTIGNEWCWDDVLLIPSWVHPQVLATYILSLILGNHICEVTLILIDQWPFFPSVDKRNLLCQKCVNDCYRAGSDYLCRSIMIDQTSRILKTRNHIQESKLARSDTDSGITWLHC